MLRLMVLLLFLLNLAYLAWSQGALLAYGLGPAPQSEPHRLQRQLHPEQIRLLSPQEAQQAEALARRQRCLRAGPFGEKQLARLLGALTSWPLGSWRVEADLASPQWLVYLGRLDDPAELARQQARLKTLQIDSEPTQAPELMPGLTLGSFTTQAEAEQALAELERGGVRMARVVHEASPRRGAVLVLPLMDDALRARLDELRPALATRTLRPCAQ
ncbi:MAG: hypothetical protein RL468_2141 [Pseudomonadota bacterium]|jgi:hypothetical protein